MRLEKLRRKGSVTLTICVFLLVMLLALYHPMEVYAAQDPGLDSGNAVVDRTSVPGQTILKYQTTGNSTFKAPAGVTSVRVLVVGGGAGGGSNGGGGGGGRAIAAPSMGVTAGTPYSITVGGGGTGGTNSSGRGNDGGSSSISSLVVAPGGGGGGGNTTTNGNPSGNNGGSGGGVGRDNINGTFTAGLGNQTGTVPSGGTGYGNNGGGSTCTSTTGWCGGAGGGGAAAAGSNGSGNGTEGAGEVAGKGGDGVLNDITGSSTARYAAGGGGGRHSSGTPGAGGAGGGGAGSVASATGGSGTANTGSGGGAGGYQGTGGAGGSGIVIIRFATQTINAPTPGGVSGLTMWYKADSAGNTNSQWNDSTGFGYNLTQGTASKQPALTTNSLNFNPAYVFDGTDDVFRMDGQGIGPSDPMSAFYAALSNSNANGYRYFNEFSDDTPSISMNNGKPDLYVRGTSPVQYTYNTDSAFTPHIFSFISPNANNQSRIIGVDDSEQSQNVTTGTYTTSSGGQSGNSFGSTNGSSGTSWSGPIAEAMYFNKVLTAAERLKIISYLAVKYGVTRAQGSSGAGYADSAGTTIWPADSTFKSNIAGIGRDDASALSQKQSKSSMAGDIVTIGHGAIAATNQDNSNNFGVDKAFLLWGHDGAATNQNTTVDGAYVRMNRIWKAVRTTSMGTIKVRVPKSAVTQGANGVMYVSSSTTFNASSQKINMTDLGTEYEATVTALPAATSYFSFGSLAGSDIEFVSKTATDIGGTPLTNYTPGEPIEYKLTVKNNGPDNAGTVTVTDTLPIGIIPVAGGASGGGWNCNVSGQTVTCTRAALNAGVTAPAITIEATVAANITGTKSNTATASVANDPDTSNNSASLDLPAAPKADLSIAKGHTGLPVAGSPHTYNFTVTNNGPSDASSFTVTDVLDSNLTFDSFASVSGPTVSCSGTTTVTCTGAAIANGQTSTFSVTVNVSPSYAGGTINNTGTVSVPAGTTDPNAGNNSSTDASNVLVNTEIGVVKTHTGNFVAGVNNNFTITVDNQGPSDAPVGAVTVTDTLDEDFAYVSAAGTGWSCSDASGTVTCTNTAVISAGGSAPVITLTVLVDSIAKGSTSNTAEVSSTTPDPDLSDNTSTDNVTIDSEADLAITKGHVGTTFVAGQQEQYTFSVVNNGPSADSPSYTITDTLPTGVTFVSTEAGSSATCTGTTTVTCTGGGIGAGDPAQVTTINVAVAGSATGTLNNSATVATAAGTTDPTPGNNTSNDSVGVEPNADLSLTKTPSTDVTAGANATYTISVHNGGPSNVSGFTVTDDLDPNLTYVSSSPNICSVTGTTAQGGEEITCTDITGITSGNDSGFDITVTVDKSATPGSTIGNTAVVATPSGVNDPDTSNNSGSVDRGVVASADLQIAKTHTGNFTAGSTGNTFSIVVTNAGPSDAGPFTVTDTLPAGMTYVSAAGTAGVGVTCNNSGQTITCTGNPGIGAGQTSTITLTVGVDADTAGNTILNNTASVASATPDPDNSNNSDTDGVTIDSSADLAVIKTNDTDFTAGSDEDYTVEVINNGPSDVSGFTVTDTLPAELTFVASGSSTECSAVGQSVTCNGGALASGTTTNLTIRVHTDSGLTAGTVVNNTAVVATVAPTTDPDNSNNSSTDPTTVVNVTDLSIQKNATGSYIAGQTGQFTFTVNNAGPSTTPAGDVEVVDTLPSGMTFNSGAGTGWDCTGSAGQDVDCIYTPALAASDTTPLLTVTVDIASNLLGQVENSGTVVSTFDDSDPADDTDNVTVNVTAQADLTATKTRQGTGNIVAGEPITYRFEVTNNNGPSDATNVVITDNLQGNFTYQSFASVSGGTWSCGESGGIVTCTLPALDVNDTAIVDVTLVIAGGAPNPLTNEASVTFSGTDPSPANPSSSNPLTYSADLEVDITHEDKTFHAGDSVDYIITAINHGSSTAQDAVLTVTIPEGLSIDHVSAEEPGGSSIMAMLDNALFPRAQAASNPFSCHLNGSQLICNASTLAVGSYKLYVTGNIANNYIGNIVLAAHITSATPDPNLNDTSATDMISDVLAARGLADTGQNIALLIFGAVVLIGGTLAVVFVRRKGRVTV